jgi:hypothetical protein
MFGAIASQQRYSTLGAPEPLLGSGSLPAD